ncbi:hypothetical protein [Sphingomonas oligophenolica]|uniref:Energy transducer TonB n=1 Tax=Sphingomonas oligophenolica TaxID=301154 RepID=A0A502CI92_9SPHN|nr:hypothetical protein [Sphingomonas oligophenolica]TPG12442.1 hypothetical protein EAH84_09855 [Sphingomonas oligophenolica]
MRSASYQSGSDRRRALSLALTIAAHILILLLLLRLGPALPDFTRPEAHPLSTFDVIPAPTRQPRGAKKPAVKRASGGAPRKTAPSVQPPAASTPPPPPPPIVLPHMLSLFEAGDISKLPSHPGDRAGADAGDGSSAGKDSGSAYGPGEGPGGARLYNAEWLTEPARSQTAPYLPATIEQGSWGMIACKTIPDNRVDNCRSLSESPLGSGISRGLREAAWQFRIRPPRIGGKPVIGAWVKIRFDFTRSGDPLVGGRRG